MNNAVRPGSLINFYGTQYIVDSVHGDILKVTMGNGVQKTIWWTDREGCEVLKY